MLNRKFLKCFFLISLAVFGIWGSGTAAASGRVLVVSGSPNIEESIANRTILEEIHKSIPQADILYLDKIKVESREDVDREHQRILNSDVIVFQYPIYWYQPPAVFKNYQDTVFTFGFAHDAKGGLLTGKKLILSCTSGAPEKDYAKGKRMNHRMIDFQLPLIQFADLCGMDFEGLIYSGSYNLGRRDKERHLQAANAKAHAQKLIKKIKKALND